MLCGCFCCNFMIRSNNFKYRVFSYAYYTQNSLLTIWVEMMFEVWTFAHFPLFYLHYFRDCSIKNRVQKLYDRLTFFIKSLMGFDQGVSAAIEGAIMYLISKDTTSSWESDIFDIINFSEIPLTVRHGHVSHSCLKLVIILLFHSLRFLRWAPNSPEMNVKHFRYSL